jgi:hypothetical protein
MKRMKRREFIRSGAAAILLLQAQASLFGLAPRKNRPNILLINLACLNHLNTPGITRLLEIGTDLAKSSLSHPAASGLSGILQDSQYRNFHLGNRDIPGKNGGEYFTVLHEEGWCGELSNQDLTSGAKSFFRNYKETHPFFLSIAYLSPGESCSSNRENYLRSVERLDLEIELLLQEVERSHWSENTTVLYTWKN